MRNFFDVLNNQLHLGIISEQEECCVLTARMLGAVSGLEEFRPGTQWWEDANVWDESDRFSSVRAAALVKARVTGATASYATLHNGVTWKRVKHHLDKGKWYFFQGWRKDGTGHAFFGQTSSDDHHGIRIVESSRDKGLRVSGVRWSMGDKIPPFEFTPDRLLDFQESLGLVELW